jgi:hypothetical protein
MKLNYEEIVNDYVKVLESSGVRVGEITSMECCTKILMFTLVDINFCATFDFNSGTYKLVARVFPNKNYFFEKTTGICENLFDLIKEIKYES